LLGKNVLQLDVKLLFLLNKDVFLSDLLGFSDETLLKGLNLLDQFIGVDVGWLKFAPPMDIERLFELILKEFLLKLLLEKFFLKQVNFTLEVGNALSFSLSIN